jgi:SAM-dependent methyltransferase
MKDLAGTLRHCDAKSILEVGCGDGRVLRHLAEAQPGAGRLVGVDVKNPAAHVSADLLADPKFEWITAPGHDLPFEDGSFDLAVIAHVLHHLEPQRIGATLAEMKRVLRPGGVFLIYEMIRDGQSDAQMSHVRYHHWISEIDRLSGVSHNPTFLRSELLGIVGSVGLDDLEIEDFNEEKDDPLEPGEIEEKLAKIDARLESIRTLPEPDFERLARQADEIRAWIRTHGIMQPTRLVATGRNPG